MTSHELATIIRTFLKDIKNDERMFIKALKLGAEYHKSIYAGVQEFIDGEESGHAEARARTRALIGDFYSKVRSLGHIHIVTDDLMLIENRVEKFFMAIGDTNLADNFTAMADSFRVQHNDFLVDRSKAAGVRLANVCNDMSVLLTYLRATMIAILGNLEKDPVAVRNNAQADGNDVLILELAESAETLIQISGKIYEVQELYTAACKLLSVDESKRPLKVLKVETGSYFIELIGDKWVLAVIVGILEWLATRPYLRAQLNQVKLEAIVTEVQANLLDRAKREGLPADQIERMQLQYNENIEHVFNKAGKLLGDKPVKVNNAVITAEVHKPLMLDYSPPKQLTMDDGKKDDAKPADPKADAEKKDIGPKKGDKPKP